VILEVERDEEVPLSVRLRRVLKGLLRQHGVRCLWIESADEWTFGSDITPGVNQWKDENQLA
jgi:hypothetical protein